MALLLITLREFLEYSLILFLITGVYKEHRKALILSAAITILAGVLLTLINHPVTGLAEKMYSGFLFYSFIMILLLSLVSTGGIVYPLIGVILALLLPSAILTEVVMDGVSLRGGGVYLYAATGALMGVVVFIVATRSLSGLDLRRFIDHRSVMIIIATLCFLFGGMNEFDDTPVIVSLQRGIYHLLSSLIPFLEGTFLIPHGGIVRPPCAGFFDYLGSQRVAMAITAIIIFMPMIYVFLRLMLSPEPSTEGIEKKAERRKVISTYIDELIRRGTPVVLSLFISIVLLHSANLRLNPVYDPEPMPIIVEGDEIEIPLTGQDGDISDGRIRKYSFDYKGETYRFLIMMRPDGKVIAALDACDICPPEGYIQRGGYIVCKYCGTPIPVQSMGESGGCNPIPLEYRLEDDRLILRRSHIIKTYERWVGD
jgi:hypothetical protein